MQQPSRVFAIWAARVALAGLVLGSAAGCPSGPTAPTAATAARVPLTVACADPVYAARLGQQAKAWGGRTGVAVRVVADFAAADVLVIPPGRLGATLTRPGFECLPLPASFKANDHPVQRARVAEAYRDTLCNWAGVVVALPLLADGAVLVYQADRLAAEAARAGFAAKFGRPLQPPRTYEDVADVAGYFAGADGRPSLPPLPAAPGELSTLYLRIVACYDRPASGEVAVVRDPTPAAESSRPTGEPPPRDAKPAPTSALSLLADPFTGDPRFQRPGFLAAARWLAVTAASRPKPGTAPDPGGPVLELMELRDLARLPLDPATGGVAARFAVAPLPGTRSYFDADGKPAVAAAGGNYVPLLGGHALVGVVRQGCADPQAAWDFLADAAAGPGSAATLSDPATGGGPFRRDHVDEANERLWLGYKFDAEQSRNLSLAMRRFLALNVANPVTVTRLPDADARLAALEATLRRVGTGGLAPEAALAEATASWKAFDAKVPPDDLARLRRNAAGLP